ncbi:hypothetical protein [uncultured Nocardioides sp.]|uniref:Gfo/Idh/MocA family protein n=1 Tax=uncultured Nocardioides sp. TaxID=198441 RepID=UPI00262A4361|nr:hypothetical protein [uncultured Nocardioides sp.]
MGVTEPTHVTDLPDVTVAVVGDGPRTPGLVDALLSAVPGVWLPQPARAVLPEDLQGVDGVLVGDGVDATEVAVTALRSGLPVLVAEPPTDPRAAETLLRADREAEHTTGRSLVQVGFARRHDPRFRELRGHAAGGALGRLRLVRGVEPCRDPDGGLVHALDTVAWLVGRPVTVAGTEGGDDVLLVSARTEDGPVVDLELRRGPGDPTDVRWEVHGSEGSAEVVTTTDHLAEAHRILLTAWVRSVSSGVPGGARSADGCAAALGVAAARASRVQ